MSPLDRGLWSRISFPISEWLDSKGPFSLIGQTVHDVTLLHAFVLD